MKQVLLVLHLFYFILCIGSSDLPAADFTFCDEEFLQKSREASKGQNDVAYFEAYYNYQAKLMTKEAVARGYLQTIEETKRSTSTQFKLRYGKEPRHDKLDAFNWKVTQDLSTENEYIFQVQNLRTGDLKEIQVPRDNLITMANRIFKKNTIDYKFKKSPVPNIVLSEEMQDIQKLQEMSSKAYVLTVDQLISLIIDDLLNAKSKLELQQIMCLDLDKLKHFSQYVRKEVEYPELNLTFDSPLNVSLNGYKSIIEHIRPIRIMSDRGVQSLLFNKDFLRFEEEITMSHAFSTFYQFVHEQLKLKDLNQNYAYSLSFIQGDKSLNLHYLDVGLMKTYIDDVTKQNGNDKKRFIFSHKNPAPQFQNLPEKSRRYIADAYQKRLNINENDLQDLIKISEEMENRTSIIVSTKQPFAKINWKIETTYDDFSKLEKTMDKIETTDFESFDILGSISIVESKNSSEKLPLEVFTGFQLERPENGIIVEIGRFSVDMRQRGVFTEELMNAAFLKASHTPHVKKIVVEMEKNLAERLVIKYGFKKIHERTNFEGKTEFILEVTPEVLFNNVFIEKIKEAP
ncbi:MAG: hypothetical protein ACOYL6_18115 [Bacteriovoracaceae bacterium]